MITKVDKIEAQRLMDCGFSDREIGERFGYSTQRIHQLRHSWQLPLRLAVMDEKVKQGLAVGLTCNEVGWRLGMSDDRVYSAAKRQGISVKAREAA